MLFDGFFFGRIPQVLSQCYASTGVIPYCTKKGKCYVLLGLEDRSLKRDSTVVWSYFGGKKNKGENPIQTAVREFTEETLHCCDTSQQLSANALTQKLSNWDQRFPFWFTDGLTLLFFLRVDYDESIPESFQQARESYLNHHSESSTCDQLKIGWVRASHLLKAIRNQQPLYPGQNVMKHFAAILHNESLQHVLSSKFELLEKFEQVPIDET